MKTCLDDDMMKDSIAWALEESRRHRDDAHAQAAFYDDQNHPLVNFLRREAYTYMALALGI